MAKSRKAFNPFYPLAVVIGVIFLITACAYGVMAFRGASPELVDPENEPPLMRFLSEYGAMLFMIELGVLMVATVAAIMTDEYWTGSEKTADVPTESVAGKDECDELRERDEAGDDPTAAAPNASQ